MKTQRTVHAVARKMMRIAQKEPSINQSVIVTAAAQLEDYGTPTAKVVASIHALRSHDMDPDNMGGMIFSVVECILNEWPDYKEHIVRELYSELLEEIQQKKIPQ